jgi:hypothetical protein
MLIYTLEAPTSDVLDEMMAEAAPAARRDGLEREVIRLREVLRGVDTRGLSCRTLCF